MNKRILIIVIPSNLMIPDTVLDAEMESISNLMGGGLEVVWLPTLADKYDFYIIPSADDKLDNMEMARIDALEGLRDKLDKLIKHE